jgi:type II secretory pathway pseudopilin PulG
MMLQGHALDGSATRCQRAFTLTEVMVSTAVCLLVMSGVITTYLFGLRLFEFTKPKLSASDDAREAVSRLAEEVRSAHIIRIGHGSLSNFTEVVPNVLQRGTAIQIYASTNTNVFTRYYWDAVDRKLKRTTNGSTFACVVANSVSNDLVFTSEDFKGTVLTNNLNNRVIGLKLEFYQIQYPVIKVGPGEYYDYYKMETRLTRRKLF